MLDNLINKKKPNPFEGAIKRRIKARQDQIKQTKPAGAVEPGSKDDTAYKSDEPDITKRRKGMGGY